MKIKYLTIRNIASVESADIDFEHGPVNHSTGRPAALFLITGDTGSGKSVILDSISMALYGTTPRVKGVNGVRNNTYRYGEGNEVSVNDIRQYTRLGISHRDPCFARLVFTGNDGVDYESTFTLGYNNRHKFRDPEWTLKIGRSEMIGAGRKDEIQRRIVDAVGLSFEQFGRMAMLAQGQFANFLTGKKDERERILEQLTATDHFSRYGEAISGIFRRANEARTIAEKEYETYRGLILGQEEVTLIKAELEKIKAESTEIEEAANAETTLEKALRELADAKGELAVGHRAFKAMEADLEARVGRLEQREATLKSEKDWLESLGHKRAIFENSTLIIERIGQYTKAGTEIENKKTDLKKAEADRLIWAEKVISAETEANKCTKAVDEIKAQIDNLTEQRRAMNPDSLLARHTEASNRHKDLDDLRKAMTQAAADSQETAEVRKDVKERRANRETLAVKAAQCLAEETRLEQEMLAARNRYTTMHLSVQKNFNELRQKLVSEHISHCPLCRQAISDHAALLSDADFKHILSPLEADKIRLEETHKAAKEARTQADKMLSTCDGALKTRTEELGRLEKRDAAAAKAIGETIEKSGLDKQGNIIGSIEAELRQVEARIARVKEQIDKAEEIQKAVDAALKTRSLLDEAKANADKDFKTASTSFQLAETNITNLAAAIIEMSNTREELNKTLSETLRGYLDEWAETPQEAIAALKADAAEYSSRRDKTITDESRLKVDRATLEALTHTSETLAPLFADFEAPEPNPDDDITDLDLNSVRNKWTDLHSMAAGARSNMDRSDAQIAESRRILQNFRETHPEDEWQNISFSQRLRNLNERKGALDIKLSSDATHRLNASRKLEELNRAIANHDRWNRLNSCFGGTRFRTLVQSHILRPLLRNANIYLQQITDHFTLTCSDDNEHLSILVLDRYNRNETRSVTVLSGGERFMISLALSLALSAMSRPDMNVDILFIDEGFGTLDAHSLEQVISTLRRLPEIAGQTGRRVGVISHREELADQIDSRIILRRCGEGRSRVEVE